MVRFITPEPESDKIQRLCARRRRGHRRRRAELRGRRRLRRAHHRRRARVSLRASPTAATAAGSTGPATRSRRTRRLQLPTPIYTGATTESNANYSEHQTARLALKWKVNDALEIMPSIYYQRLQINDTVGVLGCRCRTPSDNLSSQRQRGDQSEQRSVHLERDPDQMGFGLRIICSRTPRTTTATRRATSDYTQYLRATWSSLPTMPMDLRAPVPTAISCRTRSRGPATTATRSSSDDQRNFYQEIRLVLQRHERAVRCGPAASTIRT